MVNPEQSDYGQEGDSAALVPGSLVVYRHFQVDVESGQIAPMNYRPDRHGGMGAWSGQAPYPYPDNPGDGARTYDADCIKSGPGAYHYRSVRAARYGEHEKAPTVWCTCGFYAHYDPTTDFYPAFRWGRLYHQLAGSVAAGNMVVVRAVVEVSGTVVMGSLGVRAEHMKILALAIDWDKRVKPSVVDRYNFLMNRVGSIHLSASEAYRSVMLDGYDKIEEDDAGDAAKVDAVARRYGAKYYADTAEMYAAYPKPDVSALLPAPEPESVEPYFEWDSSPIDFGQVSSVGQVLKDLNLDKQYRDQINAYMHSTGITASYNVGGILPPPQPQRDTIPVVLSRGGGWVADTLILDEIIEWREETPFQRAMRLKKDRPAPPGTGIDRRRGRLR